MIDRKILELSLEKIKSLFKGRVLDDGLLEELKVLNSNYKKYLQNFELLKFKQKKLSNKIKQETNVNEVKLIKNESQILKKEIISVKNNCFNLRQKLFKKMLFIPNIPDEKITDYKNDYVIKCVGEQKKVKNSYLNIVKKYGWVDWMRTSILSGSKFVSYLGVGAKLRRALINFMLDFHSERGYFEVYTPLIVNDKALLGTGNLPKFKNDLYQTKNDKYLIPTSEVTLTNFFANKIFQNNDLPVRLTQFSPCFRKEAGAAGHLNQGLMRLHQFSKVEIVKIVHPLKSNLELKNMVLNIEEMLKKLKIPYRIKVLAVKNLGFSAAKTIDFDVWMPFDKEYREVSSCSNCKDFQSRRIFLKFKNNTNKNEYLHTINGSGLAIDRLFAAALENWQTKNGFIKIPKVLYKFFPHKIIN